MWEQKKQNALKKSECTHENHDLKCTHKNVKSNHLHTLSECPTVSIILMYFIIKYFCLNRKMLEESFYPQEFI